MSQEITTALAEALRFALEAEGHDPDINGDGLRMHIALARDEFYRLDSTLARLRALLREAQPIVEAAATQAREAIRRSDDSAWDEAALATDEAGLSSPDLMRRIDAALKG